ncbi:hypothetical protein C0Q70_11410 [Pomacea canaliculata]|uniref:ATPase dynein-related AAA domain-containing protein n=1 Tax=Pomacea canaliculata TaxID=400727 RepID=A0A2T7P5W3_POMCA|nr:hypothetical protein C0Q70_11410 [Pomacea canaliculata]
MAGHHEAVWDGTSADIGRHLLEISEEVEAEVRTFQRQCLIDADSSKSGLALSLDNHLQKLKSTNITDVCSDPGKEVERLKSQVHQLQRLIQILQTQQMPSGMLGERGFVRERLTELATILESQLRSLKCAHPGVGGVGSGTFEWVDSVLVKALQSGAWLLIDNVNFCSPSVLDRLNALLEPGGVLTINERGATDGSIPTIKPHPHFRLFLTMDPKHGEISRAMRNRGVEIYIPGEEDGCPYSHHDILSMLQGRGLGSQMACDWLMQLHSVLRERLPSNERPEDLRGKEFQNFCFRRCGYPVRARRAADSARKRFKQSSNRAASGTVIDCIHLHQYQENSMLTTVQEAARVLCVLASRPELFGFEVSQESSTSDYTYRLCCQQPYIFVGQMSRRTWKLAVDWLKMYIVKSQHDARKKQAENLTEKAVYQKCLQRALHVIEMSVHTVFEGLSRATYDDALNALCCNNHEAFELLVDQPWDLTTNPQLLQRVMTVLAQCDLQYKAPQLQDNDIQSQLTRKLEPVKVSCLQASTDAKGCCIKRDHERWDGAAVRHEPPR